MSAKESKNIKQAERTEMDNKEAEIGKTRQKESEVQKQKRVRKERQRERENERERSGGRAGGEAPRRQMKIMRTFLSGKIYKIVPVLLKFKISLFFSFSPFLPSSSLPPFLSLFSLPPLPAAKPYYQL